MSLTYPCSTNGISEIILLFGVSQSRYRQVFGRGLQHRTDFLSYRQARIISLDGLVQATDRPTLATRCKKGPTSEPDL